MDELYPEHASKSVVCLRGQASTYSEMELGALVSVLDEAERLYESA